MNLCHYHFPLCLPKEHSLRGFFVCVARTRLSADTASHALLFSSLPTNKSQKHCPIPIPIELPKTQAKNGVQFRRERLCIVLWKHQIRQGHGFGLSFQFVAARCFCRQGRLVHQRWCQRLASGLLCTPSDWAYPRSICCVWSQCSVQYLTSSLFFHLGHSPFSVLVWKIWVLSTKGVFLSLWVGGSLGLQLGFVSSSSVIDPFRS